MFEGVPGLVESVPRLMENVPGVVNLREKRKIEREYMESEEWIRYLRISIIQDSKEDCCILHHVNCSSSRRACSKLVH